jgi:hypothetical protein
MSKMKKRTFEKEYVQVPNETAQAPQIKINKIENENPLSLEALGLLVNMWSYNYENFDLHKTELYKRFAYNKETSVKKAWKQLIDANYMIEFKYRDGKRWEYVYVFNILPYTEEQKQIIWQESIDEYGEIWGLDFPDLKTRTSKCGPQKPEISNTGLKKDLTKEIQTKEKEIIDDEEAGEFRVNKIAFQEFVHRFEKQHPDILDNDTYNAIYEKMHEFRLARFTYKEAVTQIKYMKKRISEGKLELGNFASYFVCGIKLKRSSEKNEILQEKIEEASKEYIAKKNQEKSNRLNLPFYNWLEE